MGLDYYFRGEPKGSRIALLEIAPEVLLQLLCSMDGTYIPKVEGIPEDARVVAVASEQRTRRLYVYVESESFGEVGPGDYCPTFDFSIRTFQPTPEELQQLMPEGWPK